VSKSFFFLDSQQNLYEGMQKIGFSPKEYFAVLLFKVNAWLSNQAVRKIGLML
jgi:hypothetical protein